MATREQIEAMLGYMESAFPNFHPGPGAPVVFYDLLADLDEQELRAAVRSACSEPHRAFAPSAGEIRGALMDLRKQARGLPSASQAWEEVRRQIVDVGYTGTPQFSVPLVGAVVDRFGWRYLCLSEDGMADRAHFLRAYEQAAEDEMRRDVQLPQVTHYIEQHSALRIEAGMKALLDKVEAK